MNDDDKVKRLPVRFKHPPREGDTTLHVVTSHEGACNHSYAFCDGDMVNARYLIREGETEVECSLCNARLDPMFVLLRLAREETQWQRTRAAYLEEGRRLQERKRFKCEKCGTVNTIRGKR